MKVFAESVHFTMYDIVFNLNDNRVLYIPLNYFTRLKNATKEQLENYVLSGGGTGIHWKDLDEDLDIQQLFLGNFGPKNGPETK